MEGRLTAQQLGQISSEELRRQFPEAWQEAHRRAGRALANAASPAEVKAHADALVASMRQSATAPGVGPRQSKLGQVGSLGMRETIVRRLEILALKERLQRAATLTAPSGAVTPLEARLADWLLFNRDRSRKVPNARLFRALWAKLPHRASIAATLQGIGIWSVYTRQFVTRVARLIDGRATVEIGAGDGTLSLALEGRGVAIRACDDRSWAPRVRSPEWVVPLRAEEALVAWQPRVVLCAWPPPDNAFEASILASPSVETYVAIVGAVNEAAGNHRAWGDAQKNFQRIDRPDLAQTLMPPELGSRVVVFQRSGRLPHADRGSLGKRARKL